MEMSECHPRPPAAWLRATDAGPWFPPSAALAAKREWSESRSDLHSPSAYLGTPEGMD